MQVSGWRCQGSAGGQGHASHQRHSSTRAIRTLNPISCTRAIETEACSQRSAARERCADLPARSCRARCHWCRCPRRQPWQVRHRSHEPVLGWGRRPLHGSTSLLSATCCADYEALGPGFCLLSKCQSCVRHCNELDAYITTQNYFCVVTGDGVASLMVALSDTRTC